MGDGAGAGGEGAGVRARPRVPVPAGRGWGAVSEGFHAVADLLAAVPAAAGAAARRRPGSLQPRVQRRVRTGFFFLVWVGLGLTFFDFDGT